MEVSPSSARLSFALPEGVFTANCPTREQLNRVMSKWSPLLLAALADGPPLRWSELRRKAAGITEKMLAQTLRALEDDGFVHREARPVVPPHVEYTLTPEGERLAELVLALMSFIADRTVTEDPKAG